MQFGLAAKAKESIEKKLPKTLLVQNADKINSPDKTPEHTGINNKNKSENNTSGSNSKSHTPVGSPPKEVSPMLERYLATATPPYPTGSPSLNDKAVTVTPPHSTPRSHKSESPTTDKAALSPLDTRALASPKVKRKRHHRTRRTSVSSDSSVEQKRSKSHSSRSNSSSSSRYDINRQDHLVFLLSHIYRV